MVDVRARFSSVSFLFVVPRHFTQQISLFFRTQTVFPSLLLFHAILSQQPMYAQNTSPVALVMQFQPEEYCVATATQETPHMKVDYATLQLLS